jgi:cytochrome b561
MTNISGLAKASTTNISGGNDRFDQVSMALHWLTALLIAVQFLSGWSLGFIDEKGAVGLAILNAHRNFGALVWLVGVARLVWRHNFAYLPPFPQSMPQWQQKLAKANEYALYVLLLIQPVTGLGRVLLRGHAFVLWFWEVPVLFDRHEDIRHLLVEAHEIGAHVLLAMVGLHAGAALIHRFVLRDGVLQRMLPRMSGRTKLRPTLAKSEAE